MKLIERIFIAEDKTSKWIETNRFKWYSFLAVLGASIGFAEYLLLGATFDRAVIFMFSYSFLLVACEFALGGEGIRG